MVHGKALFEGPRRVLVSCFSLLWGYVHSVFVHMVKNHHDGVLHSPIQPSGHFGRRFDALDGYARTSVPIRSSLRPRRRPTRFSSAGEPAEGKHFWRPYVSRDGFSRGSRTLVCLGSGHPCFFFQRRPFAVSSDVSHKPRQISTTFRSRAPSCYGHAHAFLGPLEFQCHGSRRSLFLSPVRHGSRKIRSLPFVRPAS